MKVGNVLFSAVHFFVVFLVLSLGILFLALPYADVFRIQCVNFLMHPDSYCSLIGGIIVGVGIVLFVAAYIVNRRSFIQIEMQGAPVDIEEGVIRRCALSYFQEKFPDREPVSDVVIKGKSMIEIITALPKHEDEEIFEEMEEELGMLLSRRLGYHASFTLTFVET